MHIYICVAVCGEENEEEGDLLGYEEAMKLFRRIDNEKSPEFTCSNVVAQEKELEALVGYAAAAAAR